jgi:NADPH-dependent 2,4-dienoyl-CoA reductase/sulfur reductase-like enzyme
VTSRDAGRVVIVGGGLAGYSAATELRARGHLGPIIVVEPESACYDRPPLSKDLFSDAFDPAAIAFADDEALAAAGIETRFGRRAVALDAGARTVVLDDTSVLEADTILIATGGRARMPAVAGIDDVGAIVIRRVADALELRGRVRPGIAVIVVGAGLIGAEIASALVGAGADVILVDPAAVPLAAAVGDAMAVHLHAMHERSGVAALTGTPVAARTTDRGVELELQDGSVVVGDLLVVGVGIEPNVELAADAGIDVDNGILVGPDLQTSAAGVFAAGDVARRRDADGVLHRREEHWEAARLSGQEAAAGMLGAPIPRRGAPWFWSDRHGVHLEAVGRLSGRGEVVVRDGGEHPAVFLVDGDRLVGAVAVDDTMTVRAARRLIDQSIPVSPAQLADASVSLRALVRSSG